MKKKNRTDWKRKNKNNQVIVKATVLILLIVLSSLILINNSNDQYSISLLNNSIIDDLQFSLTGASNFKFDSTNNIGINEVGVDCDVELHSCKDSNWSTGTTYCINKSITTTGTCFKYMNTSVIFDCEGYTISGDEGGSDYGFEFNGYDDVTIRNCKINKFGRGIQIGSASLRINISNSSFENNTIGLYLDGDSSMVFNNNTIISNSDTYAIYLSNGDDSNITNNTFYGDNTVYAVYVSSNSRNNSISGNKFLGKDGIAFHSWFGNNIPYSEVDLCPQGKYGNFYNKSVHEDHISIVDCGPTPNATVYVNSSLTEEQYTFGSTDSTYYRDLRTAIFNKYNKSQNTIFLTTNLSTSYPSDTSPKNHVEFVKNNVKINCMGHNYSDTTSNSLMYGFYAEGERQLEIKNCSIGNFERAIFLDGDAQMNIHNNSFEAGDEPYAIYASNGDDSNITNNTFHGDYSTYGIYISSSSRNNSISGNKFLGNDGIAFHAWFGSVVPYSEVDLCPQGKYGNFYNKSVHEDHISIVDCGPTPNATVYVNSSLTEEQYTFGSTDSTYYRDLRTAIFNKYNKSQNTIFLTTNLSTSYSSDTLPKNHVEFVKNNVKINCMGYNYSDTTSNSVMYGFYADGERQLEIKNCSIGNFDNAIFLDGDAQMNIHNNSFEAGDEPYAIYASNGDDSNITNNTFHGDYSTYGIYISSSSRNNSISGNKFLGNDGIAFHAWFGSVVPYSEVDLCPQGRYGNFYNGSVTSSQVLVQDCGPIPKGTIYVNKSSEYNINWGNGVTIPSLRGAMYSVNKTVEIISGTGPYEENLETIRNRTTLNCNGEYIISTTSSGIGLNINEESFVHINNCTFDNFDTGVQITTRAVNNTINNSFFINNDVRAILVTTNSEYNKITNNNITSNSAIGIDFQNSDNNEVSCNLIRYNPGYGVKFNSASENNTVSQNNFYNNNASSSVNQSYSDDVENKFNITGKGNFWDDFNDTAEGCIDSSGFCTTAYNLVGSGSNQDNHPYVSKVSCEVTINNASNTEQIILNSTNIAINGTNQNLTCYTNITDTNGDQVYANFTWYNNSVEMEHLRGQYGPFTQGTLVNVANLIYKNTTSRENWTCSIQAYDGTDYESDWNNATINIRDSCGHINSDFTLQNNVISESTCFIINASDITLDCAGYNINYSYSGIKGFGINVSFNNVTIKNCNIFEGSSSTIQKYGVWTQADNITLENNTIITTGDYSYGVYLFAGSDQNKLTNNKINTTGYSAYGIHLQAADRNIIQNNVIKSISNYPIAIRIFSNENLFINNNLSSDKNYEIYDHSKSSINYLIYNNSYGEIKWLNDGSESFITNLTINVTNKQGIGLGKNLFIGNNSVALNLSAFNVGRINSSANITLKGLDISSINQIKKADDFLVNSSQIQSVGTNCDGTTCKIITYNNGILKFNISSFGSFAGNFTEVETSEGTSEESSGGGGESEGEKAGEEAEETGEETKEETREETTEIITTIENEEKVATVEEFRYLIEEERVKIEIKETTILDEIETITENVVPEIPKLTDEVDFTITITNDAEVPIRITPEIVSEIIKIPESLADTIDNVKNVISRDISSGKNPKKIVEKEPPIVITEVDLKNTKIVTVSRIVDPVEKTKLRNEDEINKRLKEQGLSEEEINQKIYAIKLLDKKKVRPLATKRTGSLMKLPGFNKISIGSGKFSFSGKPTSGNLLGPYIKKSEVLPGEKLRIRGGLSVGGEEEYKITLESQETITGKISTEARTGGVVDVDIQNKLINIYMVSSIIEGSYSSTDYQLEVNINEISNKETISTTKSNLITGSAIADNLEEISNKDTIFAEIYGPFEVKDNEGMIVAQELNYDPEQIKGKHDVVLKVFNREGLIAENIFRVNFDTGEVISEVSPTIIKTDEDIAKILKDKVETVKLIEKKNVQFLSQRKFMSLFGGAKSLTYSGRTTAGDYLKIKVFKSKETIINPGESFEQTIKVRPALTTEKKEEKIKIKLLSSGETVFEQEKTIVEKPKRGGIINIDAQNNLLDIYMVIPKGNPTDKEYTFEFTLNKKGGGSEFAELYGPYKVSEEGLILAQEFIYNHRDFKGQYIAALGLYSDGKLIEENRYNVNFNTGTLIETIEDVVSVSFGKIILSYSMILLLILMTLTIPSFYMWNFKREIKKSKPKEIISKRIPIIKSDPKSKDIQKNNFYQKLESINNNLKGITNIYGVSRKKTEIITTTEKDKKKIKLNVIEKRLKDIEITKYGNYLERINNQISNIKQKDISPLTHPEIINRIENKNIKKQKLMKEDKLYQELELINNNLKGLAGIYGVPRKKVRIITSTKKKKESSSNVIEKKSKDIKIIKYANYLEKVNNKISNIKSTSKKDVTKEPGYKSEELIKIEKEIAKLHEKQSKKIKKK